MNAKEVTRCDNYNRHLQHHRKVIQREPVRTRAISLSLPFLSFSRTPLSCRVRHAPMNPPFRHKHLLRRHDENARPSVRPKLESRHSKVWRDALTRPPLRLESAANSLSQYFPWSIPAPTGDEDEAMRKIIASERSPPFSDDDNDDKDDEDVMNSFI